MEIAWVMITIILLAITYFAAMELGEIAKMKGHDKIKYALWCFFCFPFGAAMVIALPDRGNKQETVTVQDDELPDL